MSLCRIVYLSEVSGRIRRGALETLVREAAEKNHAQGISGLLLHSGGNFIQVLEGDVTRVVNLFRKIAVDPRHKSVRTLAQQTVESRLFPDWGMELADTWRMQSIDHAAVDKTLIRLRLAPNDPAAPSQAISLLQEFRRQLMKAA